MRNMTIPRILRFLRILRILILQVPQDLADDPDQADLGVDDFHPGQVVHTELLVKLIEFLNILSELE